MQIRENVPLGPLTTMRVGGPARYFVEAESERDVREALAFWKQTLGGDPSRLFILGGGSNLIVSDSGFDGLVIHVRISGFEHSSDGSKKLITCGAGEDWDSVVARTVALDCAGVECLSGIPGTVGGTPVQNVGAYGQDVSETIVRVRAIEIASSETHEFTNADCAFSYRTSRFNTTDRGNYVITSVSFALEPEGAPTIKYADLQKHFADRNVVPTVNDVRNAVLHIRGAKGMVLDDNDPDSISSGSFFKNPIISHEQFERIAAAHSGTTIPRFAAANGHVKVPAAWLIERSGLRKGFQHGTVGISSKHTLALINRGEATAADLIALMNLVQHRVHDAFGIELEPEPVMLGF